VRGEPGVEITAPLSVAELGFSLHARTTVRVPSEKAAYPSLGLSPVG